MRKLNRYLVIAIAMTMIACGGMTSDVGELDAVLSQDFGGLSEEDEEPMFGEEDTYADLEEADADPEAEHDSDPAEAEAESITDESVTDLEDEDGERPERDRAVVFAIRAAWGRKHFDPADTALTQWNPTFTTDCGVLGIRRLVRFDREDSVVRPRTGPQSASFVSATAPSFDGVVLALAIPAAERECVRTGTLTITSDALPEDIVLPLSPDFGNTRLRVEVEEHREFVLMAQRVERRDGSRCIKGYVGGRWIRATNADGAIADKGRFYGRVLGPMGELRGHIRGVWGQPREGRFEGRQVMFGKLIDVEGRFIGLMAGRYGEGHWGGGWHLKPSYRNLHGFMGGLYEVAPDETFDGGLFRGRYASAACETPGVEEPLAGDDEEGTN